VLWLHIVTCETCVHSTHVSQVTLTTSCTTSTYLVLTKCVILAKYRLWLPDYGFPCKPKHVGAVLLILKCFNDSTFLTLCASVGY